MENSIQFLKQSEAASYLRVSPRTLEAWRVRGGGPKYHRVTARCIRYSLTEIQMWLSSRELLNTSGDCNA